MKTKFPIKDFLITEYKNLGNFAAPAFIAGILLTLGGSPLSFMMIATLLFIITLGTIRFHPIRPLGIILIFLLCGMGITNYRLMLIHAPTLSHPISNLQAEGQVETAIPLFDSQKIILNNIYFLNEVSETVPEKIRLTYMDNDPILSPGDKIRFNASLRPPLSAATPHGYNEAQSLFFQKIGAVGTIHKIISLTTTENKNILNDIRFKIKNRIQSAVPLQIAQIATALTIGEQNLISADLYRLFQTAGISHILSVSGFHMGLLALFIFIFIRVILSLIPFIPDSFPSKKIAVIFAFLGLTGYLLISGMHVPAIRSFIMISIVLIAILFDRNALSLRSLNIAAILVLSFSPELILEIGFQLSFMAVLILISLYRPLWHFLFPHRAKNFINRLIRLILSIFLTSFLIGLFTLPITAYHFNQYALYSILGNILCIVLFSFFVMPFLFWALILMPIGGDIFFLKCAGFGISYLISVCDLINGYPHALLYIPSFNTSGLILMITGLILLLIMRTKLRFFGILFLLFGILSIRQTPRPDLMIGDKGQTIAVRKEDGSLKFIARSDNPYLARLWLTQNGEYPSIPPAIPLKIDQLKIKDKIISFDFKTCGKADLCFLPTYNPTNANALSLFDFKNRYIYIGNNKISVQVP